MKKRTKIILLAIPVVLIAIGIAGVMLLRSYPADAEKLSQAYAQENIEIKSIETGFQIDNTENDSNKALIFYPGGLVEPEAYLYNLSQISKELQLDIFLVKFPLNLGVLDIDIANRVREANPSVTKWYIAGHSLGGSMACRNVLNNLDKYEVLFLMSAYCDQSITEFKGKVVSIVGSNDGVINKEVLESSTSNLPVNNIEIKIEGMTHAQFGSYGEQRGDGVSEISDDEVVERLVEIIEEAI